MSLKNIVLLASLLAFPARLLLAVNSLHSPNNKIHIQLSSSTDSGEGETSFSVAYNGTIIIPKVKLGLETDLQRFVENLKLVSVSKPKLHTDDYVMLTGKRMHCTNSANESTFRFKNNNDRIMEVTIRSYNNGIAFRYAFPDKEGTLVVKDEITAYTIPDSSARWLEKFNPANEGIYKMMLDGNEQKDWCYPALFNSPDKACWYLIHEADVDRSYCGTKLTNYKEKNVYKLTFPDAWNGRGKGETQPTINLPWKSPWRVVIIGSLSTIVESTLVNDVSRPSAVANTNWIKPGIASWNYWSDNHGTRSFKTVCKFADLAASMDWPYTLLDWEWDAMADGGNLEDALKYIHSLGVKPLIWYNSGGDHTWVNATPKDRMLTHENRVEEFSRLKKLGIYGVKVDFFESEKQDMISYYLDILDDAAKFEMMVYFHGCLVPRGWQRTYPHLMTYEGVRGAEWYNNGPELTMTAPEHNNILPFTRNVVGSMDYTPVTFTYSQYAHITSYGHELALSVVFESGMQHFADRPEGYYALPFDARSFLSSVPNVWDNTKLIDGYPGKFTVIVRQKGTDWYVGGINADGRTERVEHLNFDFLPAGRRYHLTLISDGNHDKVFTTKHLMVDYTSSIEIKMLRRGGFVVRLQEDKN